MNERLSLANSVCTSLNVRRLATCLAADREPNVAPNGLGPPVSGPSQDQELLTGRVRLALYMLDRGGDVRSAGLQHVEAAIRAAKIAHDTDLLARLPE
jgi:hypothetical protein